MICGPAQTMPDKLILGIVAAGINPMGNGLSCNYSLKINFRNSCTRSPGRERMFVKKKRTEIGSLNRIELVLGRVILYI